MIINVYSINDALVGFGNPTLQNNDAAAMRSFAEAFKDVYSPADYALFRIGTFDTETGIIESEIPSIVCRATDFVKENENVEK